jgi:hypothetical protein
VVAEVPAQTQPRRVSSREALVVLGLVVLVLRQYLSLPHRLLVNRLLVAGVLDI